MTHVREYRLGMGGTLGTVVAGVVLLVVVGVFLTFGLILLLGLAAVGLLIGIAAALRRRFARRGPAPSHPVRTRHGLDPALEVKPPARHEGVDKP